VSDIDCKRLVLGKVKLRLVSIDHKVCAVPRRCQPTGLPDPKGAVSESVALWCSLDGSR